EFVRPPYADHVRARVTTLLQLSCRQQNHQIIQCCPHWQHPPGLDFLKSDGSPDNNLLIQLERDVPVLNGSPRRLRHTRSDPPWCYTPGCSSPHHQSPSRHREKTPRLHPGFFALAGKCVPAPENRNHFGRCAKIVNAEAATQRLPDGVEGVGPPHSVRACSNAGRQTSSISFYKTGSRLSRSTMKRRELVHESSIPTIHSPPCAQRHCSVTTGFAVV